MENTRFDDVEIKVNIAAAGLGRLREVLGLDEDGERRRIFFCEDVRSGGLPLLDGGVVLRLRRIPGRPDATAKLRPCDVRRLPPFWLEFQERNDHELRIEQDRSAVRQTAASLTARLRRWTKRPEDAFTALQRRFLEDCTDVEIPFDQLSALGPVHARRWRSGAWSGPDLTVEHWSVHANAGRPLEFLEVSTRVGPDAAESVQAGLLAYLKKHDLPPDPDAETKTRRVLAHLAREQA